MKAIVCGEIITVTGEPIKNGHSIFENLDFFKGFTSIYALELAPQKNTEKRKLFEVESMKRRRDRTVIGGRSIHFGYFYNHLYVLNKREYIIVKMDSKVCFKTQLQQGPDCFLDLPGIGKSGGINKRYLIYP